MNYQNINKQQGNLTEEEKLLQILYEYWHAQRFEAKRVGNYERADKQEYVLSLLSKTRRIRKAKVLLISLGLQDIADSFTQRGINLFKEHISQAMIIAQEQNHQETAFLLEQIISILNNQDTANSCRLLFEYIDKN